MVVVVWCCLPNTVQPGDAGEFSTVMLAGGVPHPSGYPWIRALGWVGTGLMNAGLPPALAAAIPCASFALLGIFLLARLSGGRGTDTPLDGPSLLGASLFALSPLAVRHLYDAEVWGPHLALCMVAVLACQARRAPLVIGLALGLAVSNHLTAVLLVPLAVGAAWPRRGSARALLRAGGLGVLGSALGLLPLATLAIGGGGAWRWGDTQSIQGLFAHVTRQDFGTFQMSIQAGATPDAWPRLARALSSLGDQLTVGLVTWPPLVAAGLLALAAWWWRQTEVHRATAAGWLATLALTSVAFPLAQNVDPSTPMGRWICERFDLLPLALWIPLVVSAARRAVRRAPTPRLRRWVLAAMIAAVAAQALRSWPERPRRLQGTQAYAVDLLAAPGAPAIVFGTDDHRTFPVLFATEVLSPDTETLYIDAALLYHGWYRDHILRRWSALPLQDQPLRTMSAIWADPELRDTPIYLANIFSEPASRLQLIPEGHLWRVVPPHAPPDFTHPEQVASRHLAASRRMTATRADFVGAVDPETDPFGAILWRTYAAAAKGLSRNFRTMGVPELAAQVENDARGRGVLSLSDAPVEAAP